MEKETREIIKLTTKEILLTFTDAILTVTGCFSKSYKDKIDLSNYLENRSIDRQDLSRKIYRLKKQGLIRKFVENKKSFIELTNKGREKIKCDINNLVAARPKIWDKKWRIVIFDIPEKDRAARDFVRRQLYRLGFIQIQKSVFIYPFECSKEINLICDHSGARKYIKYMITEIIEGEQDIIKKFINNNILSKKDINISNYRYI